MRLPSYEKYSINYIEAVAGKRFFLHNQYAEMNTTISIQAVQSGKDLKEFICLSAGLYRNDPFLYEGFDSPPVSMSPYNPEFSSGGSLTQLWRKTDGLCPWQKKRYRVYEKSLV